MPIVFEEVTTEIAPPAPTAAAAPLPAPAAAPVDALASLRHQLALLAERQARLVAD